MTHFVELAPIGIDTFDIIEESLSLFVNGSFDEQIVFISMYQLRSRGRVKPHAHFKRTAVKKTSSSAYVNIWHEFKSQFPFATNGQTFGFNIQFANAHTEGH